MLLLDHERRPGHQHPYVELVLSVRAVIPSLQARCLTHITCED